MKISTVRILVGVDFSEQSLIALEQTYNLSRLLNAEVTLLHIMPLEKKTGKSTKNDEVTTQVETDLETLITKAREKTKVDYKIRIERGKVEEVILAVAKELKPDLIFIGLNSEGKIRQKIIGLNAINVIKGTYYPVITIKGKHHKDGCDNIIVPLDLSKSTRSEIEKAVELAKIGKGATVRVVSVIFSNDEFVINKITRNLMQIKKFLDDNDVLNTGEIIKGTKGVETLAEIIVDYANKSDGDIIVITTQQKEAFRQDFIGTTAKDIIKNSEIPVMSIAATV